MRKTGILASVLALLICGQAEALFSANDLLLSSSPPPAPALVLDHNLKAASLPAGITFTRASVATDIIGGVVTNFTSDQPRISTTNGLLIEPARTNLVKNSSSTATNGTLTSGQTDPAGGTSAWLYTATNTTTGQQWSTGASTIAYANGTTYTVSAFVKAGTADRVQMFLSSSVVANGYANYYLNGAGSVTATGAGASSTSITSIGSGWYRIAMTFTATSWTTNTLALCELATGSETRAPSIAGGSKTMYFYGGQVEAGATLTSYIPTTTAAVTRAADVAYYDLSASVYANTIYVQATAPQAAATLTGTIRFLTIQSSGDATSRNSINRPSAGGGNVYGTVITSGTTQADMDTAVAPASLDVFKAALAAEYNDMAAVANAGTVATDSSSPNGLPTVNRVKYGSSAASTEQCSCYIQAAKVWNYRRTNADIQTDTTP